jgi:hypothetical protein
MEEVFLRVVASNRYGLVMISTDTNVDGPLPIGIRRNLFCTFFSALILYVDLQIPLGVASAVPFVAVILVALWAPQQKAVLFWTIVCSVLTLIGFYLSPPGGELWKVVFNRMLALFSIWTTAILALQWKFHEREASLLESRMEKEKEKIYLATISGAQHITNNLLNELKVVEFEIDNHPDFDKEVSSMFENMVWEASTLMKNLSAVDNIDDQTIRKSVAPT